MNASSVWRWAVVSWFDAPFERAVFASFKAASLRSIEHNNNQAARGER
jgi:hypothetical protein